MQLERQGIVLGFEVLLLSCIYSYNDNICTSCADVLQDRSCCRGRFQLYVVPVMDFTSMNFV